MFDPPTELTSLNRSLFFLSQVIMSTTSTTVQNLVEIHTWGLMGKYVKYHHFFYLYPFCRSQFILMPHFKMAAEKHHNHTETEIVYMQAQ